jgi:hypothetical protein
MSFVRSGDTLIVHNMDRLYPMQTAYIQEKEQRPCTLTSKAFTSNQTIHVFFLCGCDCHHYVTFHTSEQRWTFFNGSLIGISQTSILHVGF